MRPAPPAYFLLPNLAYVLESQILVYHPDPATSRLHKNFDNSPRLYGWIIKYVNPRSNF